MSKILLSKEKINNLKDELKILENDLNFQMNEQIKKGGLLDSWHETAAYQVTQEALKTNVSSLKKLLKDAKVLSDNINSEYVVLGSYVVLRNMKDDKTIKYRLVHPVESDPRKGKLSLESPLGKLLLHNKINQIIEFNDTKYLIIRIY